MRAALAGSSSAQWSFAAIVLGPVLMPAARPRGRLRAGPEVACTSVPPTDGDSGRIVGDAASERWLKGLAAEGPRRDQCISELHGLLLRAARREVYRRRGWLRGAAGPELDDLAQQAPRGSLFCGELDETLIGLLRASDPAAMFATGSTSVRRAGFLAELAWHRFARGERAVAGFVEPLYLREPQITKAKPRL